MRQSSLVTSEPAASYNAVRDNWSSRDASSKAGGGGRHARRADPRGTVLRGRGNDGGTSGLSRGRGHWEGDNWGD